VILLFSDFYRKKVYTCENISFILIKHFTSLSAMGNKYEVHLWNWAATNGPIKDINRDNIFKIFSFDG
jgi:hypothetical protein